MPPAVEVPREERGESAMLRRMANQVGEMYAGWHALLRDVMRHDREIETHDRRLDRYGHRISKLEEHTGLRESDGSIPTGLPPMRAPAESFSDLAVEERTLNGTETLRGTREQLQKVVDARVQFILNEHQRNSDAATTKAVRVTFRQGLTSGAKGALALGVTGMAAAVIAFFKLYIDRLINGEHHP